jgi:[protein-PII] uridylyltransferase
MPKAVSKTSTSPPESAAVRLQAAREALGVETLAGGGGRSALERFSDRLDVIVRAVTAEARRPTSPLAIVALGGYGRRHLCLHSDIDLLVLFGGAIGPAEETFLRDLLHALWDLDLVVGHQVRTASDFDRLEHDNPEFLLALLDARLVQGDGVLLDRVTSALQAPDERACILDTLLTLTEERHARFNDTPYQLEPDVKDAPGGLRDVLAARQIARLANGVDLGQGSLLPGELEAAEEFLLRIRSVLHLEGRRNVNVLTHEMQERTAALLASKGIETRHRVERLMGDYFRHARTVYRSTLWARRASRRPTPAAAIPVGPNLAKAADGIHFVDATRAGTEPATWLGAFEAALVHACPVSDAALACIRQHAEHYQPGHFYPTPDDRRRLLAFLRPRPGLYDRLTEMHDCELLGCMFPEFRAVSARVTRDFHHKYTVDEHSLLAIRTLERLAGPGARDLRSQRFGALLSEVASPELIVLSLLLHDVGKWRDGNHVIESGRMARTVLARLDLPQDARETVEVLIASHLHMSLVAFRRDTEDPDVVKRFADQVGSEDRLKMLCLLTLADVEAVSPDTLSPWKEELLWRLYVDTYNELALGYGDELIDPAAAGVADLLATRPADLSEREIVLFVAGLPRRYLQFFGREAIYRHVRLSRDMHPDEVHLFLEQKDAVWELTVATLDKPFLFSNISGTLSSFGMDIVRGHALTNLNGLVLDTFQFEDRERFFELNPEGRTHLTDVIGEVVSGRTSVATLLRGREQSILRRRAPSRFRPVVHVDGTASQRYTILEILADNAFGLLHRVSRVISHHGCDVDLVLISTEGERAIDVFHLTKAGAKLSDLEQQQLTTALHHLLEGAHEAD